MIAPLMCVRAPTLDAVKQDRVLDARACADLHVATEHDTAADAGVLGDLATIGDQDRRGDAAPDACFRQQPHACVR